MGKCDLGQIAERIPKVGVRKRLERRFLRGYEARAQSSQEINVSRGSSGEYGNAELPADSDQDFRDDSLQFYEATPEHAPEHDPGHVEAYFDYREDS